MPLTRFDRVVAAAIVPLLVSGCASVDTWARSKTTTFAPIGNGIYAFSIIAHGDSADTLGNEEDRILNLEKYLAENSLCHAGYVIESKTPVKTGEMIRGAAWVVHYRARCKT